MTKPAASAPPALLPCPFCGSANIDPRGWASTDSAGPACDDCGASAGGVSTDLAENIAAWNKRAEFRPGWKFAPGSVHATPDFDKPAAEPVPVAQAEWHVRHIGAGLLAQYHGDEYVRDIGPTPGWDFKDRDEFIVRYNDHADHARIVALGDMQYHKLLAKYEATEASLAACRADAERYRWLRDNGKPAVDGLAMRSPEHWDAAIDAARSKP